MKHVSISCKRKMVRNFPKHLLNPSSIIYNPEYRYIKRFALTVTSRPTEGKHEWLETNALFQTGSYRKVELFSYQKYKQYLYCVYLTSFCRFVLKRVINMTMKVVARI